MKPIFKAPASEDTLYEFQRTIGSIVKEIGDEYNRYFTGEGALSGEDKDSPRNKPGSTVYSTPA